MASSFTVRWEGDKVLATTRHATRMGMDSIMADCVNTAMSQHAWQNRTGILTGSHRFQPTEDRGDEIVGYWGAFANNYAIFLEEGTKFIPKGKYTWLAPASRQHYPSIGARIRSFLP